MRIVWTIATVLLLVVRIAGAAQSFPDPKNEAKRYERPGTSCGSGATEGNFE